MPALPWSSIKPAAADQECVIMASRLPLARYRHISGFLRATVRIRRQLAGADGLVGYSLDAHPLGKTFWTLSAWESQEALETFSRANPHHVSIEGIRPHMRPTTFVFWTAKGADLPIPWSEARRRVNEEAAN